MSYCAVHRVFLCKPPSASQKLPCVKGRPAVSQCSAGTFKFKLKSSKECIMFFAIRFLSLLRGALRKLLPFQARGSMLGSPCTRFGIQDSRLQYLFSKCWVAMAPLRVQAVAPAQHFSGAGPRKTNILFETGCKQSRRRARR